MSMKVDKSFELSMMSPLKITMMLLVVLYHSCVMWAGEGWFDKPAVQCVQLGILAIWLNTFHVAAFVFASGYLYSYLRRETGHYGTIVSVLTKKAKRLLLPYAAISILWAAPIYALFFGSDDLIWKFAFAASPSQLWFLPMLYWCFVVLELVRVLLPDLVERPLKLLLYAVGISFVAPIVSALVGNILQLASAFQYLPVFCAGYAFRAGETRRFWSKGPAFWIIVDLVLFFVWSNVECAEGFAPSIISNIILLPLRLAGCAVALSVLGTLNLFIKTGFRNWRMRNRVVKILESDSLGVYLFHQQIIFFVLSKLNIPSAPPMVVATACFFISMTISIGLSEVLSLSKRTKWIVGKG